jgi:hypothetical protein
MERYIRNNSMHLSHVLLYAIYLWRSLIYREYLVNIKKYKKLSWNI